MNGSFFGVNVRPRFISIGRFLTVFLFYAIVSVMKIAICDDEQIFVTKLHKYLWSQTDCSVDCFLSPLELLSKYEAGIFYDVVFLDILMEPMNGITLAHKLREYDKNTAIIFLTAYGQYAPEGYEVRAFRYLLKPITRESVLKVMQELRSEWQEYKKILIKTTECEFLLSLQDIYYVEANNKDCIIYYNSDRLSIRRGLTDLETLFPKASFYRIHRKYLVNLAHVREFDETRLTLDSNQTLPISRRRSFPFRNALERYIEGGLN